MGNVSLVEQKQQEPIQEEQYFWKPPRLDLSRFPPYTYEHEGRKVKGLYDIGKLDPRHDKEFIPPPGTPELSGERPSANMFGIVDDEPDWLDDIKHKPPIPSSYFVQTDYMND